MSKFKVGDKVRLVVDLYEPTIRKGDILEAVEDDPRMTQWITTKTIMVGMLNDYPEEFELVKEESPQMSNEKPSYVSFFTSVIVAKNKAVSDIGEMLYDENTTKIYLEDEGGGAFLIVEQDYNGAIQQIRLDIDEVDAVFSAIKQLVNQLEGK